MTLDYSAPLTNLRGMHESARCFVVGNGPSLTGMPLQLLEGEIIFSVNRGYLARAIGLPKSTYYIIADPHFYRQYTGEVRHADVGTRFYRQNVMQLPEYAEAADREDAYLFPWVPLPQMDEPGGFFSTDFAATGAFRGGTVIIDAFQIAFYMCFKEVYLLGCDLNYDMPTPYFYPCGPHEAKSKDIIPMQRVLTSMGMALQAFSQHGRKLINCTRGGRLEVLPRMELEAVFNQPKPSQL
jgi:hypothetical protein